MALKATQGLLCSGYYPSSSPTLRKQLTQSWCKLVQNHRLSKFCDQRITPINPYHVSTVTTTLLLPSPSTTPSSSSVSLPRFSSSSTAVKVSPLSMASTSCPLDNIDDQQFRSMFDTWETKPQCPVGMKPSDEPSTGQCPFSGSKGFPSQSSSSYHLPHNHHHHHDNSSFPYPNRMIETLIVTNNSNKLHQPNLPETSIIRPNSSNYMNSNLSDLSQHQPLTQSPQNVKSFNDIPTPKSYPIVGTTLTLMAFGGAANLHEYCNSRHKELGPIYREKLGPTDTVFIADSSMVQKVYSNEGRFPNHLVPEAWTIYNEMTGIKRGLFFMDGPEWEKRRKGLNKVFLCQPVISDYTESFNQVVTDIISKWSNVIDDNTDNSSSNRSGLLTQLERELYNWSIESLGTMIFGRRLGCVETSDELKCKTHKMEKVHLFVQCVQQLFVESAKMTLLPARLAQRFNLPVWQRFMAAAGQALSLARTYVEENVAAYRDEQDNGSRGVLEMLLAQPRIDQEELIRIIVDLFLAAADTTSHATQWALYLLSKNPEYQQKILEQVESVVGKNGTVRAEHLKHFTLVKGVIKETLRLYPVAPFISRKLDRDIVLGGYHIPANSLIAISLYTTGRDEKYWPDAASFKPERWIRDESNRKIINSHASLPFGFGIRSCVGRRVAEVQMQFLLSRVIQKFYIEPGNADDIGIKLRMITTPESPIHLRLIDRQTV